VSLPEIAEDAREKFEQNKDLLEPFVTEQMAYDEFAARVRRRSSGQKEDNDWPDDWPKV
jgi:hypothetical protein